MTGWFADTFFFLALGNRGDVFHERARGIIDQLDRPLVTTAWVLTEVADALAAPHHRTRFLPLLEFLLSHPCVTIVPPEQDLFQEAIDLYVGRPDKAWSLTDCISFVAMKRRGLTDALTGDRHFEQAGFRALLK